MRKIFNVIAAVLVSLSLLSSCKANAQKSAEPVEPMSEQEIVNREIFDRIYSEVKNDAGKPMGELTVEIAQKFLGTEYIASTLEKEPEELQVFLDKTDCILFVELSSCFALTVKGYRIEQAGDGETFKVSDKPSVKKAEPSYELLCDNIRNMRYRLGVVDGYPSRVHYTSEWILQNQTNGIMKEFSQNLGSQFQQKFSYMSKHPGSYMQLKNNPSNVEKIQKMESHLEAQAPFFYVSQAQLRDPKVISQIEDGDIITFISKTEGLDLAHVALALKVDGVMHFIHASSKAMKVIIEEKTLADYATNGLRVCRFNPSL